MWIIPDNLKRIISLEWELGCRVFILSRGKGLDNKNVKLQMLDLINFTFPADKHYKHNIITSYHVSCAVQRQNCI